MQKCNLSTALNLHPRCLLVTSLPNDKILDLVQIQRISRQQNKCNLKTEIIFGMVRKHSGKRRKCWLPAFSPFPTMFLNVFSFRGR